MYANADCLSNKMTALVEMIILHKPDIICITEIKPKNTTMPLSASSLNIDNYQLFNNIDKGRRGICLYVHNSIETSELPCKSDFEEYISLRIHLSGSDYLNLVGIYRSPNSTSENNNKLIEDWFNIFDQKATHSLIMGDFNMREIQWDNMTSPKASTHISSLFVEKIKDSFLYQHVDKATRLRSNNIPSLLDLILTNEEGMINSISYLSPLWSKDSESDHLTLIFDYKCYSELKDSESAGLDLNKGNYDLLRQKFREINWEEILIGDDINSMLKTFTKIYDKCVQDSIPAKKCIKFKKGNNPIWMNKAGIRKIKRKHRAWQRYLNTKEGQDYQKYARARNEARTYLRKLVREFEKGIVDDIKSNPKAFWKYVKSKSKTKSGVNCIEKEDGSMATDDQEKAKLLNNFFSSVFTKEDQTNIPNIFPLPNLPYSFKIKEISVDEIKKKIGKMKPNKSPGPDGCHPRILRELVNEVAYPLSIIFNKSLNTSIVPSVWKSANVTPIFKKGSKIKASNYRPISLTSILCKLLESFVRDQLMEYMKDNNLFSNDQHGFLPKRSCVTQLLLIIDHWTKLIDEGHLIDSIYLDFSKAFDSVPHNRLLLKLQTYGIESTALKWIHSFLTERKQRVHINGKYSEWEAVTSGVPQGSVLGPILFLIFINDLPNAIHSFIKIFADDTKIYNTPDMDNAHYELQTDIDKSFEWSQIWQLPFNSEKCKVMHIGYKNPQNNYTIPNLFAQSVTLDKVTNEKDLGITFNEKLDFSTHMSTIVKKANQMLGLVKRTFENIEPKAFITLYKAMVRSHLEYANCIWRPYKKGEIQSIEKVQRRATKCINELSNMTYTDRLQTLNLPTLEYRRQRGDMIQTYKIIHKLDDIDAHDLFAFHTDLRTRGHSLKLNIPSCNLNSRKYSFSVRVVPEWNSLPEEVVTAPTINTFKNRLDKFWANKKYVL